MRLKKHDSSKRVWLTCGNLWKLYVKYILHLWGGKCIHTNSVNREPMVVQSNVAEIIVTSWAKNLYTPKGSWFKIWDLYLPESTSRPWRTLRAQSLWRCRSMIRWYLNFWGWKRKCLIVINARDNRELTLSQSRNTIYCNQEAESNFVFQAFSMCIVLYAWHHYNRVLIFFKPL